MGISNSTNSNWGYALTIGLNNFGPHKHVYPETGKTISYTPSNLYKAEQSADEMSEVLKYANSGTFWYGDYTKIINLKSKQATLINTIHAILELAQITKPGDVVTMSFSTHGTSIQRFKNSPNKNTLFLYDSYLTESMLYVLLKFFKPNIRFYLFFDMCNAGSWMDSFTSDYMQQMVALGELETELRATAPLLANYLAENNSKIAAYEQTNSFLICNGIYDDLSMNDTFNSIFNLLDIVKQNNALMKIEQLEKRYAKIYLDYHTKNFAMHYNNYFTELQNQNSPLYDSDLASKTKEKFDASNQLHMDIVKHYTPTFTIIGDNKFQYTSKNIFSVL